MTISVSSVMLSCLEAGLMIILLELALSQRRCFRFVHADAILFLTTLILVRLCFPVEPFYTVKIQVPAVMNPIIQLLSWEIAAGLSILDCLTGLWWAGIIVKGWLYWKHFRIVEQAAKRIRKRATKSSVCRLTGSPLLPDYPVYLTKDVMTPGIMGRDKSILLPDETYTQIQLEWILRHEIRHLENRDFYKKQFVEVLIILYWWFFPVYLLRRSVAVCAEALADGEAVWDQSESGQLKYAETLIQLQRRFTEQVRTGEEKRMGSLFHSFLADSSHTLTWRMDRLFEPAFLQKTSGFCLTVLAVSAFIFGFFSIEPKFDPPSGSFAWSEVELIQSGSLLCDADGNWRFLIDGYLTEVQDPFSEFLVGVPVLYACEVPVERQRQICLNDTPIVKENLRKVSVWKFQNREGVLSKRLWNEASGSWICSWIPV